MRKKTCLAMLLALALSPGLWAQGASVSPVAVPGKATWPKSELPSSIPEYKAGKVLNYGNGGDKRWFLVYCAGSSSRDLDAYAGQLRSLGWTLGSDGSSTVATKDNLVISLTWHDPQKMIAIELRILSTDKSWPAADFPQLPPFTACMSSNWTKNEYDTTVAVYKVADKDMEAYYRLLVAKGWVGEAGSFDWRKTKPELHVQMEDQGEGTWYFSISAEE